MELSGRVILKVTDEAVGKLGDDMFIRPTRGGVRRAHEVWLVPSSYSELKIILDDAQLIELRDKLDSYIKTRGLE